MHFNPVKISLKDFAILFKFLSAHCEMFLSICVGWKRNINNKLHIRSNGIKTSLSDIVLKLSFKCTDIENWKENFCHQVAVNELWLNSFKALGNKNALSVISLIKHKEIKNKLFTNKNKNLFPNKENKNLQVKKQTFN